MNERNKTLLKAFLLILVILLVVFNWDRISWIFSYRYLKEAFGPEESPPVVYYVSYKNTIDIPSIDISVPIIIAESGSDLDAELDMGAVLYPGSAYPGEDGQTIILGHSAPKNWPKIKHDWIFSDLEQLNEGDKIKLYFGGKKYEYEVEQKQILNIGADMPKIGEDTNSLLLLSCWPPGKNYKRIAILSKLVTK